MLFLDIAQLITKLQVIIINSSFVIAVLNVFKREEYSF